MEVREIALSKLHPYENNPRLNNDAVGPVANSIKEFGFKVPIVATKDGEIINGHTRYKAALKLGLSSVPVIIADDLSDDQVKAFRLADNKTGELAEWDVDKLMSELDGLTNIDDINMSDFGFDDILIEESQLSEPEDDGYDVTPVEDPVTKLDQVWQLGNHRLMVGDSTDAIQVAKLLSGQQLDLLVTDPPYNVAYQGSTEDELTIENDSMSSEEFYSFLSSAFEAVNGVMKPGAAFYVWYASREHINFESALNATEWEVREQLIWVKNAMTLGRQDYQWRHEPCLYGWKPGASHYFVDERNLTTVLEFDKPVRNAEHPTMKPIPLFAYLIGNSSKIGANVGDMFAGSGTTLMAAEQTKRNAFVMELDPRYADVIINRWESYTGNKAELIAE